MKKCVNCEEVIKEEYYDLSFYHQKFDIVCEECLEEVIKYEILDNIVDEFKNEFAVYPKEPEYSKEDDLNDFN